MAKVYLPVNEIQTKFNNAKTALTTFVSNNAEPLKNIIYPRVMDNTPWEFNYLRTSLTAMPYNEVGGYVSGVIFEMSGRARPDNGGYDYAGIQHERPFNHPRGGDMKYLERSLFESEPRLVEFISNGLQIELNKL